MLPGGRLVLQAYTCVLLCSLSPLGAWGHGRLVDPPSRSSMWRFQFNTPRNYDDNQLFCGGVKVQYEDNGGKCGVCGDPWQGPRDNEPGGKFYTGIIVRKYNVGQVIGVKVQLTASHKGFFEFRLCPNNNPFKNVTHACLDKYILPLAKTGETKYMIESKDSNQNIEVNLKLPEGVRCSACVLQWKYNAGNSWGTDSVGNGCIGCGNQEQFYGCADVAIGSDQAVVGVIPPRHPWYFDTDDRWYWGIVDGGNGTMFAAAHRHDGHTLLVLLTVIVAACIQFRCQ
ncbi:uncharacterized protein LOC124144546 [Haliotis rufescens]|uniref:uncharacterized protein LOC124144546 n=1 Tax=Haliotis rufescens TaxID=6454 RepID=UPI001EAFDE7D|nr:uncharacterized protein LOC124144546 [Haliotis rufescens]